MSAPLCPGTYAPTRESDGDSWHVGVMVDRRQAEIQTARSIVLKNLRQARAARLAGNAGMWEWHMSHARAWRRQFAEVIS